MSSLSSLPHSSVSIGSRDTIDVNATALLALEYAIIEANWSRLSLRENHAGLVALRATLPDSGKIR